MPTVALAIPILQDTSGTVETAVPIHQDTAAAITVAVPIFQTNDMVRVAVPIFQDLARRMEVAVPILQETQSRIFAAYQTKLYRTVPAVRITILDVATGASKVIDPKEPFHIAYKRSRNDATTATIQFQDKARAFAPRNPSSPYFGWLRGVNFKTGRALNKVWKIEILVAGEIWESTWLLNIESSYDSDAESGYNAQFSLIDLSRILLIPNQNMAPWRSVPTSIVRAHTVIQAIADKYKIPRTRISSTNFAIRKFDFQGTTPMDRLNRVMGITGAAWRFGVGGMLEVFQPAWEAGPRWDFVDRENCQEHDWKYSELPVENEVEVRRSQEASRLIAEDEQEGQAGFQTITWTDPAINITVTAQTRMGTIHNPEFPWGFLDEAGNLVTSAGPAVKFTFVFKPKISQIATPMTWWHIKLYGDRPLSDPGFGSEFADEFAVTVRHKSSYDANGPIPAPEPIEDELIPDEATAEIYGRERLREKLAYLETDGLQVALNPWIEPWDKVSLTMKHAGITSTELWVVDAHGFEIGPEGGDSNLELIKHVVF